MGHGSGGIRLHQSDRCIAVRVRLPRRSRKGTGVIYLPTFKVSFSSCHAYRFVRWAWQKTRESRHSKFTPENPPVATASQRKPPAQISEAKAGRSLSSILFNLHLLLRSLCFSAWPLELHVFDQNIYSQWLKLCTAFDKEEKLLPRHLRVYHDQDGLASLQTSYDPLRDYLLKSRELFDQEGEKAFQCAVCDHRLRSDQDIIVVCPICDCHAISHITCLSAEFSKGQEQNSVDNDIVPTSGNCPSCRQLVQWPVLMKELTLRLRGADEIRKVLRRRRRRDRSAEEGEEGEIHSEEDQVVMDAQEPEEDARELPSSNSFSIPDQCAVIEGNNRHTSVHLANRQRRPKVPEVIDLC